MSDPTLSATEPLETPPGRPSQHFTPTPLFRGAALLLTLGTLWFAYEVWRDPNPIRILILVGLCFGAASMILGALARAEFDGHTLTYTMPLRPRRQISREQIDFVEVSGRRTKALVLGYYPRQENGIITTERLRFINLVPLQDQEVLLAGLQGKPVEPETGDD